MGAQFVGFYIILVAVVGIAYLAAQVIFWLARRTAHPPAEVRDAGRAPRAPVAHPPADAPDYRQFVRAAGAGWLRAANDEPDRNPHVSVCGPTGSGKSTLVLAMLARRAGHLVICTPKNARDDAWGGFPAVRLGFDGQGADWSGIGAAIKAVYLEMWRRNTDDAAPRTPLTLVIDEYTTTMAKLPALREHVMDMWTMGRSVGVRLVTMAPETNVKAWGIEGRGDVRDNILFIELDEQRRGAMYRWGKAPQPIDTDDVLRIAAEGLEPARVWVPGAMDSAMDSAIAPHSAPAPDSIAWEDAVRRLAAEGKSTRTIRAEIGGDYNRIVELAREGRTLRPA